MGNKIYFLWPLRILRSMAFVFLGGLLMVSCASVKKAKQITSLEQIHTDNSVVKNDKTKQIVIEEQAAVPVMTRPDTAGFKGWFSVLDTSGFYQEVESNGQKIKTIVKPVKDKAGNTTGYNVNTEAVKKTEAVMAPINKKTTINSSDKSEKNNNISDSNREESKTINKTAFRFNFAGAIAIVGIIALVLVFLYFILRNRILK